MYLRSSAAACRFRISGSILLRDFDVRLFDDLAPFDDVALHDFTQVRGASVAGLETFGGHAFAHLGVLKQRGDFAAPAREQL